MFDLRLSKRGYRVTTVGDGDTALEAARRLHPDLILLDVMMPGKTGWEVARTLRGDAATESIKIIMVTAIGETLNDVTSPLYSDAHIDKPVVFDRLEKMIAELIGAPGNS